MQHRAVPDHCSRPTHPSGDLGCARDPRAVANHGTVHRCGLPDRHAPGQPCPPCREGVAGGVKACAGRHQGWPDSAREDCGGRNAGDQVGRTARRRSRRRGRASRSSRCARRRTRPPPVALQRIPFDRPPGRPACLSAGRAGTHSRHCSDLTGRRVVGLLQEGRHAAIGASSHRPTRPQSAILTRCRATSAVLSVQVLSRAPRSNQHQHGPAKE
jgi:hypothetical protein